jgi:hypothetical protein
MVFFIPLPILEQQKIASMAINLDVAIDKSCLPLEELESCSQRTTHCLQRFGGVSFNLKSLKDYYYEEYRKKSK